MVKRNGFSRRPWTNAPIVLYHGTDSLAARAIMKTGVDLSFSRPGLDFGRGFYTTTEQMQASAWAVQVASRLGSSPRVVTFTVERDALAELQTLYFVRGTATADDYWNLVCHCRDGGDIHCRLGACAAYDVVAGPVAADWEQRVMYSGYDQISFHTGPAVELLNRSLRGVEAVS